MRFITVPADVVVPVLVGKSESDPDAKITPTALTFVQIVEGWVLEKNFLCDGLGILSAARIERRFEGKRPGDVVALDDADWARLRDAVMQPSGPYRPHVVKLASFLLAVQEATEEEPRKPANGAAELARATA